MFARLASRSSPEGIPSGLTEPAVDDLTRAKQTVTIGLDIPRAEWIPLLRRFVAATYLSRCFLAGAPVR